MKTKFNGSIEEGEDEAEIKVVSEDHEPLVAVTRYTLSEDGVEKDSAEFESGDVSPLVGHGDIELPEIDDWDDLPSYDDIPGAPSIDVSCGECEELFETACIVGCGVTIGTICIIVTGGIGALACAAIVSIACIVIDYLGTDACAPGSDIVESEEFCSQLSFC
ncbi:halocin C8-like domain-containing protein [Natrarchaeobaculum sulfurireducens]|uniref:halocin C8-like domain-containing protein n=1 Tax=Natrarchaeobaculum sulfurireducens TaxID=2044521 RepID=UPI001379E1E4|nr:halocin C8-like domain-containing protein [Natrarchaeobaculum sulfurireducens]